MTGVTSDFIMTPVTKTQVYLSDEDLKALHRLSKRSGKSVAALIREAVRTVWLRPEPEGPVAVWDGPVKGAAMNHDAIYDGP